jgi:hypothetical protein
LSKVASIIWTERLVERFNPDPNKVDSETVDMKFALVLPFFRILS